MSTLADKARALRALHHDVEPLVFLNVWDVATAKLAVQAGCPAVATSSASIAFAYGFADGERIPRATMLEMVGYIARAVDVPVTADLEAGYGPSTDDAIETARAAVAAGAAGLNFEDALHAAPGMTDVALQTARVRAVRETGDALGVPLVINARTDAFLIGGRDPRALMADAIERGNAYLRAGADCIFVPGVADAGLIAELVAAIPAPLNILANASSPPLAELRRLGVKRVSLGSAPGGYALAYRSALNEVRECGTFAFAERRISHADLNALMS